MGDIKLAALAAAALTAGVLSAECALPCCGVALLSPVAEAVDGVDESVFWTQGEAETNKIDLLIGFDASAVRWLETSEWGGPGEFAEAAIAEMNAGLANTELDRFFTFRLAGTTMLGCDLSSVDISRIALRSCGISTSSDKAEKAAYSGLRAMRDAVKADLVAVMVRSVSTNMFGSSVEMSAQYAKMPATYSKRAYCVCAIDAALPRHSLLHEVGHLMGAGHADNLKASLSPGPGAFAYSSGYSFMALGRHYTSVMGYPRDGVNADITWERLPFFSSPDYELAFCEEGTGEMRSTGVAVGTRAANDNSRTLRETYAMVANFRVARKLDVLPEPPEKDEYPDDERPQPALALKLTRLTESGEVALEDGETVAFGQFVQQSIAVKTVGTASLKTTVKVKGLPSGMKYVSKTGLITGFPKKAGRFVVSVTATDKARHKASSAFTVSVGKVPEWAFGTFDGLCVWDGCAVPVTLKVSSTGRITGKFTVSGRTCSAYVLGFASADDGVYRAEMTVKVAKNQMRKVPIVIEPVEFVDRLGAFALTGVAMDGFGGRMLQDVWSRKDVLQYKIKKSIKVSLDGKGGSNAGLEAGDELTLTFKPKGKLSISGRMSGVRVSGSSRLSLTGGGSGLVVVVLPAKGGGASRFAGYSCVVNIRLVSDAAGIVSGITVTSFKPVTSYIFD